jgi:predicted metalloenzyme YecM
VLYNNYQVECLDDLKDFYNLYIPLVRQTLSNYGSLELFGLHVDHLGLQVASRVEFDLIHEKLLTYCEVVNKGVIHERRNNTYRLQDFIGPTEYKLQSIEMFEPKPGAETNKLKLGIEHIAFVVEDYDGIVDYFTKNNIPVAKTADFNGSKFFKTIFVNLVEIEFRNDYLWQTLSQASRV